MITGIFNGPLRNWSLAIIVFSFVAVLATICLPFKSKQFGDGDFHVETKELALFLVGQKSFANVSITKAPGPVIFYAFPYLVAAMLSVDDQGFWLAGVIWTHVVTTVTILLLFYSTNKTFGLPVARTFIVLLYLIPLHVYYSFGIMAESMAFMSVCWIMIGFFNKENRFVFYFGFIFGLVGFILARPNAGLSLPLLVLGALIMHFKFNEGGAKGYVISAIISFAIITSVVLIIKKLPNNRRTLRQEEYLAFVMHHGRFQFRHEPFDWRFWDDKTRLDSKDYHDWRDSVIRLKSLMEENKSSLSSTYFHWIFEDVKKHPLLLVRQFLVRIVFGNTLQISSVNADRFGFFGMDGIVVFWVLHVFLNLVNYGLVLCAFWFVFAKRNFRKYWPLISLVLALWMFHGFVYMEQRYLFPVRPILLFFAAMGILSLNHLALRINYGK